MYLKIRCDIFGKKIWGTKRGLKQRWEKPKLGWMKVNVDGSFDMLEDSGGVGVDMRDSDGKVLLPLVSI